MDSMVGSIKPADCEQCNHTDSDILQVDGADDFQPVVLRWTSEQLSQELHGESEAESGPSLEEETQPIRDPVEAFVEDQPLVDEFYQETQHAALYPVQNQVEASVGRQPVADEFYDGEEELYPTGDQVEACVGGQPMADAFYDGESEAECGQPQEETQHIALHPTGDQVKAFQDIEPEAEGVQLQEEEVFHDGNENKGLFDTNDNKESWPSEDGGNEREELLE